MTICLSGNHHLGPFSGYSPHISYLYMGIASLFDRAYLVTAFSAIFTKNYGQLAEKGTSCKLGWFSGKPASPAETNWAPDLIASHVSLTILWDKRSQFWNIIGGKRCMLTSQSWGKPKISVCSDALTTCFFQESLIYFIKCANSPQVHVFFFFWNLNPKLYYSLYLLQCHSIILYAI